MAAPAHFRIFALFCSDRIEHACPGCECALMPILLPILLAAASAATLPCQTGVWALKASDRTVFLFEIRTSSSGTTAIWERPQHFQTDGENFSRLSDTTIRRPARSVKAMNGDVAVTFDDPTPRAIPDVFQLHCVGSDHLTATYEGTSFEPFDLIRLPAGGALLGPWESGGIYARLITRPTNPEMTAIFNADQADRQTEHIDWSVVGPADKKRLARTQELLSSDALHSGDDFYHAAFLFQHGDKPGDYLKAHLLAMVAVARGKRDAVWIASATLDRYLQAIGKPQVLGTQYTFHDGAPATQEPYDRALVSDTLRRALHVPPMAEQEQRRQGYSASPSL